MKHGAKNSTTKGAHMHKFMMAGMALTIILLIVILTRVNDIRSEVMGTEVEVQAAQKAEVKQAVPTAPSVPSAGITDMVALIDDDDVKGDPNAPVTIVEWSDFECPFCGRFYSDTLGQIQSEYIDTGKVKLVYRDFPLSFHANAQKSAEAAECAGEQDKFWEMHDLLFERGVTGGVTAFKQFAAELGLDTGDFNTCLDTGAMAAETAKDMADGGQAGVRGTPGFVINGQLVSGAQPFSNFKQIIDAELAKI
jgi:protein-disulfide isomerase